MRNEMINRSQQSHKTKSEEWNKQLQYMSKLRAAQLQYKDLLRGTNKIPVYKITFLKPFMDQIMLIWRWIVRVKDNH